MAEEKPQTQRREVRPRHTAPQEVPPPPGDVLLARPEHEREEKPRGRRSHVALHAVMHNGRLSEPGDEVAYGPADEETLLDHLARGIVIEGSREHEHVKVALAKADKARDEARRKGVVA